MNINYAAASGVLTVIADELNPDLQSLGITKQDHQKTVGNDAWLRDNRAGVVRTLKAVLFGSTEILGLPPITLPTEYIAAVITAFVAPKNRMTACHWLSDESITGVLAQDLANPNGGGLEISKPSTLFAIVTMLSNESETGAAREQFNQRMNERIGKATRGAAA